MDEVQQNTTLQHLKMLGLIILVGIPRNHSEKKMSFQRTKKRLLFRLFVAGWQLGSLYDWVVLYPLDISPQKKQLRVLVFCSSHV